MLVTALSGTTVAQLDEEEFLHMVESGETIRDLKQLLSVQVGCSRFQQRLFSDEVELQDDMPLRPLPSCQLVVLPFCASEILIENENYLMVVDTTKSLMLKGCFKNRKTQMVMYIWMLQPRTATWRLCDCCSRLGPTKK